MRIVDKSSDGWGHVNFDDFRFHEKRPTFKRQELKPKSLSAIAEVYPHAGLTAEEAAAAMQVPPGFKVQVAAKNRRSPSRSRCAGTTAPPVGG